LKMPFNSMRVWLMKLNWICWLLWTKIEMRRRNIWTRYIKRLICRRLDCRMPWGCLF